MLAFWQGGFELWPGAIAAGLVLLLTLPDNRTLARALAALAVCTFGLSAMQALIRQPARPLPPVAALHRLDGGAVSLAAYRGKPVLINLWATWCPPCRRELPMLADRQSVVSGKSVSVRVDLGGRRFIKKKKIPYNNSHEL